MALTLANNVSSLNAQHNLTRASGNLSKSIERLSSGLKVNQGADGPAALVISEKQRAQISGLEQAIENGEKAVAVVQTAEGALNEINSLLVKARSLALDSANSGVNDADSLAANQAEINNLVDTIDRIANNTQFGTKKLLDGSAGVNGTTTDVNVSFIGATSDTSAGSYNIENIVAGERATASNTDNGVQQTAALLTAETLTINGVAVSLNAGLTQGQVISRINEFSSQTGVTAEDNGGDTRLYSSNFGSNATISVVSDVAAAANSSGFGTTTTNGIGVDVSGDINSVTYTGTGNVLTATSGAAQGVSVQFATASGDATSTVAGNLGSVAITDNSLVFQIGPNQNQSAQISISKVNSTSLGSGVAGNQFGNLNSIDVTTSSGANDSIGIIDAAIDKITNLRGELGAFQQNTLESTANNLRATLENTVNAESVIRDTDFAEEIANFTRQQVLVQAGTSVLSSANQQPQLVLSLLQ